MEEKKIENIKKFLIQEFQAKEVNSSDFFKYNEYVYEGILEDIVAIYKIDDENIIQSLLSEKEKLEIEITINHLQNEKYLDNKCTYLNKISTGKLIVIILESEDKVNLSGFTFEGNGEKLFEILLSLLNEADKKIEKNINLLDEKIEELHHFYPYGKYFK
jgi:hypothetical protein